VVATVVRSFPPLWNNLTGTFSGLNMYHIWTRGREVKSILASSIGSPGYNHYIRLFILSGIDMAITIPFNIWHFTTFSKLSPSSWPGWKPLHSKWSLIPVFTAAELRTISAHPFYELEIARWICVVYGFVFFGLFCATAEVKKCYASAWQHVSKIFCWKTGFSQESPRYMLGFVLFQFISGQLIDIGVSTAYTSASLGTSILLLIHMMRPDFRMGSAGALSRPQ
jgi:Pheromone A receptor